ncbi:hypothetical protein BJF78_28330 [Pseudonocardia sp. CNS-139]|nr:hypothetical protein BJF78_28330 [Pseudonocardia sp. CNS-139]
MTDLDDDRLGDLFRAAASDPGAPAPGFDRESVVGASRRVTARRRAAVLGAGLALVAVAGVGTVVSLPSSSSGGAGDASTVAAPMLAPAAPYDSRAEGADRRRPRRASRTPRHRRPRRRPPRRSDPPPASAPTGRTRPCERSSSRCCEVVGAPEAATTDECRTGGERGVNVEVGEGAARGLLTVEYLPPGVTERLVAGALSAPTASGGTVVVSSRPERPGEPAPLADRLPDALRYLAPLL